MTELARDRVRMAADALPADGCLLGRASVPGISHPAIVTVRGGKVIDITSATAPTARDICELDEPERFVRSAKGHVLGDLYSIMENSLTRQSNQREPRLLSPVDLHAVKAAGVTFAASLLERVIEEQALGVSEAAGAIREEVRSFIGTDLSQLRPGSAQAMEIKARMLERGIWSQYLEVAIGPYPEIFTKCQPLSSVGFGEEIGINPHSSWNNPEPEIVVIASSAARIVGATIGNDVNLRDIEGRSALLLGMAKDNNASAAIGPFIRLFDDCFTLEDVCRIDINLEVTGDDGYRLVGSSSMSQISRTPLELVESAMGAHHQYPDGVALYLGTMYVPTDDRLTKGAGFTHRIGDLVSISAQPLGVLLNRVQYAEKCPPWTYGVGRLMRDLARAKLL